MAALLRPALSELRTSPALMPFLVRPGHGFAGRPALMTGLAPLDALLGGGFPRGRISEIIGPRSSGRTSVLLGTLGCVSARGAPVALVDVTDGLDPASAGACGVALERFLWVRCGGSLRTAVQAADVIVRGGGFDVVGVDLGDLPPWTLVRASSTAFVRLQRAVQATPTALILAGPRRVTGSMATVAVALEPSRVRWTRGGPGLLAGLQAEARLIRSRGRVPAVAVRVTWSLDPLRDAEPAGRPAGRRRG